MDSTRLAMVFVVAAAIGSASCQSAVECGPGTMERDGVCVIPEGCADVPRSACGDFTHLDPIEGQCLPDLAPAFCDPDTTSEEPGDDGVIRCVGTATYCTAIGCPQPDPGKITICGRVIDAENGQLVAGASTGVRCTSPDQGGACALSVKVYDALAFADDPVGSPELAYDEVVVNDCGYYSIRNLAPPELGYVGIGVDDGVADDDHVLSGVAQAAAANQRLDDLNLYAVRSATDARWTTSAGNPFGQTFSQQGAYLAIFLDADRQPVAGVTVTENGAPQPAQDYYFSDVDPLARMTVDPAQTTTGANGSALLIGSVLSNHSGTGGLPADCFWPSNLATTISGVVFVQERVASGSGC
jgi:hypothetical protein